MERVEIRKKKKLVGISERKRSSGKHRHRWGNDIKMDDERA
jgi:hypothetical protein